MPRWWNGRHAVLRWQCRKVCGFESHLGYQILQTMIRAGVIPLEALCSDAHLLWTSCTGERLVNVPGVKDYLLSIAHVHTPRRNRIVCNFLYGGIAQLGERLHGMQEVVGSTPTTSTNQRTVARRRVCNN